MSELRLKELLEKYPFVADFFDSTGFFIDDDLELTFSEFLNKISEEELEEKAIDRDEIKIQLDIFIKQMLQFIFDNKDII